MFLATILLCGNIAMADCTPKKNIGAHYVPGAWHFSAACSMSAQQYAAFFQLKKFKIICAPHHIRIYREA
jgi:hypothetical protein